MRVTALATIMLLAAPFAMSGQSTPDDQVPASFVNNMPVHMRLSKTANAGGGSLGSKTNAAVLGVDSIPNWSSYFYFPGVDSNGGNQYTWQYTMAGNAPTARNGVDRGGDVQFSGATTRIGAPVIPVNLDLRDFDGTPRFVNGNRLYSPATQFVQPVLNSPVYSTTTYDSGSQPTQFTDAVQKAEFFGKAPDDWHTLLFPRAGTPQTMVLIRGTYRFALNGDGTCCFFIEIDENAFINAFFPASPTDTSTPIGAAENSGEIRTRDMSSFIFNNALLYANGDPNQCCIVGFHTYDVEAGSAANGFREKRYVLNFSSWITPGLLGGGFADVTALSHELSETFQDPFVNNATPWWLAPNGNCQNNLEDGDVIEGLPNAVDPITLNGATYHPQNEALLQWFAGVTPSSAVDQAYSYPNTSVLTAANVSQNVGCSAPLP